MKVFENMVLRRQFRTNKEETARWQGKLGNEELQDLYYSSHIIGVGKQGD
jgi:hypothetical protein